MPEIQPLPTPGEIAAMDGHLLRDWSVQAMGWKSTSRGQVWLYEAPDGSVRNEWDWHPEKDANHAIELAEKVFDGGEKKSDALAIYYHPWEKLWAGVDIASDYGDITAPSFALAVTRAVVICWAEQEREARDA